MGCSTVPAHPVDQFASAPPPPRGICRPFTFLLVFTTPIGADNYSTRRRPPPALPRARLWPGLEPSPISPNTGQNLNRAIRLAASQLSQHIDGKLVERFYQQIFRSQNRTQAEHQNLSPQVDFTYRTWRNHGRSSRKTSSPGSEDALGASAPFGLSFPGSRITRNRCLRRLVISGVRSCPCGHGNERKRL